MTPEQEEEFRKRYEAMRGFADDLVDVTMEGPPKDGSHITQQPESSSLNRVWWAGLIASVLVALAGQAHSFPEPWSHVASVLGTVGAGINGYLIRRP